MRLRATGPAEEWGSLTFDGEAWNTTYSTCLADTTIELDVLTESVGPDAELVVEMSTSYRPAAGAGRPAGHYSLQYRVGAMTGRFTEDDGRRGVIARRGESSPGNGSVCDPSTTSPPLAGSRRW